MIVNLFPGSTIYTKRYLNNFQIKNWRFKDELVNFHNDIMPNVAMKVVEVNKVPGNMWVKVELSAFDPVKYLKISGEEFAHNFRF